MATSNSFPASARFDQFQVDLRSGVLQRSGVRVPVQGQPLQVLRLLLEAGGKVVTREELRKVLWPEDTFVDFELGVNTAVKKLRQALTDPAEHPKFIETLPRVGYRFMIPVEWVADKSDNYSPPIVGGFSTPSDFVAAADLRRDKPASLAHWITIAFHSARSPGGRVELHLAKWSLLGVAVALLVVVVGVGIWRLLRDRSEASMAPSEMVPLVALSGIETSPAFSPDGTQVAFALEGPKNPGIYTTVVGGEKSVRLTSLSGDCCPRWSPDGRHLAFPDPRTTVLLFIRFQLSAVLCIDCTHSQWGNIKTHPFLDGGPVADLSIGRPMANFWPFPKTNGTKSMLGLRYSPSPITRRDDLPHPRVST